MAEALGGDPYEHRGNSNENLTSRASDCLAAFAERLVAAETAVSQFRTAHQGHELDENARLELSKLQWRVDQEEAVIQGATIMVEHLGLTAPDGSIAWGGHNLAASQLAEDVRNITAVPDNEA